MNFSKNNWLKLIPFLFIAIVNMLGWNIDSMDVDAAQYASISKEILDRNDFLHLTDFGRNYLDKPPLLFWLSAISYMIFGVSNFAFHLPAFFVGLFGIYCTYRLAKLYYDEKTAYFAALIYGSCQAFFLMSLDVRTDIMLVSFSVAAVNFGAYYLRYRKWKDLILMSITIGLAMMSKGPIGLVLPIVALGADVLIKKQWNKILDWKFIPAIIIIGITLLPMCIGLYQQYDSNPEVWVNGEKGVSGLKFFFWTQSFGRITGENVWNNNPGAFFLTQSSLWGLLPYTFLWIGGVIFTIYQLIKNKFKVAENQEIINITAFVFLLLALSKSSYQLPHYIFIAYPFAAIFMSNFLMKIPSLKLSLQNFFKYAQLFITILLFVALELIVFKVFPDETYILPGFILICFIILIKSVFLSKKLSLVNNIFFMGMLSILITNIILNGYFYPQLLTYQDSGKVGRIIAKKNKESKLEVGQFVSIPNYASHSLVFYSGMDVVTHGKFEDIKDTFTFPIYIYASEDAKNQIDNSGVKYELLTKTDNFKVSELTLEFLNYNTRDKALNHHYLIKIDSL